MERGYRMPNSWPVKPRAQMLLNLLAWLLFLSLFALLYACSGNFNDVLPSASATALQLNGHAKNGHNTRQQAGSLPDVEMTPFAMYAVKYGESEFPETGLFADGAKGATARFGWLHYAIRDERGKWTLVDTGFHDEHLQHEEWNLTLYKDPLLLLLELGVRAEMVSTIVITHHHADHAGCMQRFPNASLIMHSLVAAELRKPENGLDEAMQQLSERGQLLTFDGRWSEPIPLGSDGRHRLRVESIGGHAPGSSMVWLDGPARQAPSTASAPPLALLAGDEVYLPRSIVEGRPTGTTVNATRSEAVVHYIREAKARGTSVFYFHDPETLPGRLGTPRVL